MPDGAFEAFERMRTEQLRRKRRQTVAYGALFLACLAVAVTIGEFDLPLLIRNLPRITEYIGRLLPVLRPESLMADLGTWYYGIGYWSLLLLETILMARSEEHTSALQSLMRISYAVFCLKKKKQ